MRYNENAKTILRGITLIGLIFIVVLLFGCTKKPRSYVPYSPMLNTVANSDKKSPCYMIVFTEDFNCAMLEEQWRRAQKDYSVVDLRALSTDTNEVNVKMSGVSIFKFPDTHLSPSGVPRGGGSEYSPEVQGWFFAPSMINLAHERVLYCEALHYLAYILGDPGWMVTGHAEVGDKLNFACWQVVADEYLKANPIKKP